MLFSKPARMDWRKERETNQETFGHSAVRSLAFRRGRGMRGGRGMNYRRNDGLLLITWLLLTGVVFAPILQ